MTVKNLSAWYDSGKMTLSDFSLELMEQEVAGLIGLNGAGKTTFLKVLSVLLEWFYPVRNWQIESDLWRHPRKYIVPAILLLLAGAVGILPALMPILIILLVVEVAVLLFLICKRF